MDGYADAKASNHPGARPQTGRAVAIVALVAGGAAVGLAADVARIQIFTSPFSFGDLVGHAVVDVPLGIASAAVAVGAGTRTVLRHRDHSLSLGMGVAGLALAGVAFLVFAALTFVAPCTWTGSC